MENFNAETIRERAFGVKKQKKYEAYLEAVYKSIIEDVDKDFAYTNYYAENEDIFNYLETELIIRGFEVKNISSTQPARKPGYITMRISW